ncbi:MAG: hypothetical protein CVU46_09555 [Chloroflexi bacterium HGW-Chloroflexi-8]|nr:MAG: hypothetical protein CVU46_09555 [Chloroflexi bacterium HGW-Chloroflexi-8]
MDEIKIWKCELCGEPLGADHVYGPDGFDLCRFHHEKFYELLAFMNNSSGQEKTKQLKLFEGGEA